MSDLVTARVSITIPVFNGMPYIAAALASALGELGPADELIIVDNASSDGTADLLKQFAAHDRVRVVYRTATQGPAENWTQAIMETRGRYVKLLCADDAILPGCLESQVSMLDSDERLVMVAGQRTVVDPSDRVLIAKHGLNGLAGRSNGLSAIKRCLVAGTNLLGETAAVMFRGVDIRAVMPWDDRWPYVLDLATYARVLRLGDIAFVREPVAQFRVSPTSWSSRIQSQQLDDFRNWRMWQESQIGCQLSRVERVRAECALRVRTQARRAFFWHVGSRTDSDRRR